MQRRHEEDYQRALVDLKEELRTKEGEEIEEEMKEQIRKWFFEDRDDQGKFPDYPSDDEGGSASIFHPERLRSGTDGVGARPLTSPTSDSDEEGAREGGVEEEGGKGKGGGKGSRRYDDKGGSDKKGGKDAEDEEESGFTLRPSDFVKQLRKGQKTFEGKIKAEETV